MGWLDILADELLESLNRSIQLISAAGKLMEFTKWMNISFS